MRAEGPNGKVNEIHGARKWARSAVAFARSLAGIELALVDGAVGAIHAPQGTVSRVLRFAYADDGRITRIDITGDPATLTDWNIEVLA